MTKTILALTVAMMVAGCSMAPAYQRPAVPGGATWESSAASIAPRAWKTQFPDPVLQQLITTALDNNRDLRVAVLNVQLYEAQYRIQRASTLPTVSADASQTRTRTPATASSSGTASISNKYAANVGVTSYELNLFGRVASLKEQALETWLAKDETRRSTQIALVASVADAYLTLLADRDLLALAEATLQTEPETHALTQQKYDLGAGAEMDLAQSQTSLDSARVSAAQYRRLVNDDRHALTLLLGTSWPQAVKLPATLAGVQLPDVPVGAPSSLLFQRPDILAAEHSLKAANANIGAARAAFFPTISLTATAGTASTQLGDLFGGGSGAWSFVPQISLPLFDGGKRVADLDVADIETKQAVATYESTIQTAFKEVASGLDAQKEYVNQLSAQQALVKANERYFELADMRYNQGVDSYLTRLDAQRSLFSARQSLISTRLALLENQVALYKAVGGGWQAEESGAHSSLTAPSPDAE